MPYMKSKTIMMMAISCMALLISLSCYQYAVSLVKGFTVASSSNFISNNDAIMLANINNKIVEQQSNLAVNVWQNQRQKNQIELLDLLQQKLSLTPFSGFDWLLLLRVQHKQAIPQQEIFWTLENAIKLNRWKTRHKPILAYYCLYHVGSLTVSLKTQCQNLVMTLPWQDKSDYVSRLLAIEKQELTKALLKLGVKNESNPVYK